MKIFLADFDQLIEVNTSSSINLSCSPPTPSTRNWACSLTELAPALSAIMARVSRSLMARDSGWLVVT